MKNKILSLSILAAVLAAIFYFLNSTLNLLGYAVSKGIIALNSNQFIDFIMQNYRTFSMVFISILILSSLIIYSSFIWISKKRNSKILLISSILILLAVFITLASSLPFLVHSNLIRAFPIPLAKLESYLGIFFFLFGLSLIFSKLPNKTVKLLGTLYIIESIVLLSTLFLPIRLTEFTIAIRITEAFFFA